MSYFRRSVSVREWRLWVDFVEEVGDGSEAGAIVAWRRLGRSSSRRSGYWHWDEFGEFPEVLGGGSEVELVAGTARSLQSVELQNAFEMRKQHLDFLPLAP